MNFGSEFFLNAPDEIEDIEENERITYSDCEDEGASLFDDDSVQIKSKKKITKSDTNVVSIKLGTLEEKGCLMTGDPVNCSNCGAFFTSISQIVQEEGLQIWNCEFCSSKNSLNLYPEEIPSQSVLEYVSEFGTETVSSTGSMIIFCIDISGSMCVTQETTNHPLKGKRKELLDSFRHFNDDFSDQHLPGEKKNVNYVSRLQCVQAAVSSQLESLTTKVALVTFNNEVTLIGDGYQEPITLAGDKLFEFEQIKAAGDNFPLGKDLVESRPKLLEKLFSLEEGGGTALGPALLASVALASKTPGSQVIICTDGLANIGVGDLEAGDEAAEGFYQQVLELARLHGVVVNVISIQGTECRLEKLGQVSDATGGKVDIVDPLNLASQFSSILSERVIATQVTATLLVHKELSIKEQGVEKSDIQNKITRDVGTVTNSTEITFEIHTREQAQIGETLPFQVVIKYFRPNDDSGTQLQYTRILAMTRKVTNDRKLVEENMNLQVMGTHFGQQTAQLALEGKYSEARVTAYKNKKLLKKAANTEEKKSTYGAWKSEISKANKQIQFAQKTEREREGRNYSDDDDSGNESDNERANRKLELKKKRSRDRGDETSNILFRLNRYKSKD